MNSATEEIEAQPGLSLILSTVVQMKIVLDFKGAQVFRHTTEKDKRIFTLNL
jgi:hypothetical protein